MTGILMFGKTSVGVRSITIGLRIRISSAITTNVYGLRRASATIHIGVKLSLIDDYRRDKTQNVHPIWRPAAFPPSVVREHNNLATPESVVLRCAILEPENKTPTIQDDEGRASTKLDASQICPNC